MLSAWKLPKQSQLGLENGGTFEVLIEYDGPQLVLLSDDRGTRLATAVDELPDGARWIEVPLSNMEVRALRTGRAPLRDLMMRDWVRVVDRDAGFNAREVWEDVPLGLVPPDAFPAPGVLLASFARTPDSEEKQPSRIEVEGPSIDDSGRVTFQVLADLLASFQEVFDALLPSGRSTLTFAGSSAGSLVLDVQGGEDDAFDQGTRRYREIAEVIWTDPAEVAAPSPAEEAVRNHLATLSEHGLSVVLCAPSSGAYVGRHMAQRVGAAHTTRSRANDGDQPALTVRGMFEGLMNGTRSHQFVFSDASGTLYDGTVEGEARDFLANRAVKVGRASDERFEVTLTRKARGTRTYRLTKAIPIQIDG